MKENTFKAIFCAGVAALSAYMGQLMIPLLILVGLMILDYGTGMAKAWVGAQLSSRVGIKGIIKKVGYLVIVAVAMGVDWLLGSGLPQLGVVLPFEFLAALLVIIWLIINELISILENVAVLGAPEIPLLSKVLAHIKKAVDEKAEIDGSEEK